MKGLADLDTIIGRAMESWKPPARLTLSEWADQHFVLSAESAAEPGRWKTLPYQREIMDAITDRRVEQVSLLKSARIGYTMMMSAALGYFMHHEPSSILVVQPTVDDAKNYSKETIAPMLRDVPVLAEIVFKELESKGPKDSSATLTHKGFPGGVLSLVGANSGAGFRRISRRCVFFDEVDAYPQSAGGEGDPIRLGIMRSQSFYNRKIISGSTPLTAGASRIAELFESGDQRRYHVPCPHCGHMDFLTFRNDGERGHWMQFDTAKPEAAVFICRANGCVIEHKDKRWMVERGEWRAAAPFRGHASFAIWAAYSYSPNAAWGHLAAEFVVANKGGVEKLKTFVNTALGETWQERGDAPEWKRLVERREDYEIGTVPAGVVIITAGVDVQKDRLVWEVVGWGENRQSWSIDAGVIPGDTSTEKPWDDLDELLGRTWPGASGIQHSINMLAVDSGYNTQTVYNWARRHPMSRVIACKGSSTSSVLLNSPSAVDVKVNGKRLARGYKVWTIGVDVAKGELYGWLRLEPPSKESGGEWPPGYCHFPEYGEEFFKQLTAEHLMKTQKRGGFVKFEWNVIPGRENHYLDCRVLARAAAALLGLDRFAAASRRARPPPETPTDGAAEAAPVQQSQLGRTREAAAPEKPKKEAAWLSGTRPLRLGRGSSWLGKRGR